MDWSLLRVVAPNDAGLGESLCGLLDPGESEAIVVASEIQADVLLIDEADGRKAARNLGIPHTGLLGVLLEAKRRGAIGAVAPELDRLRELANFRVRTDVRLKVLRLAGEI